MSNKQTAYKARQNLSRKNNPIKGYNTLSQKQSPNSVHWATYITTIITTTVILFIVLVIGKDTRQPNINQPSTCDRFYKGICLDDWTDEEIKSEFPEINK